MSIIREYVHGLSDKEKEELISNYEELERQGYIGDCKLRNHANIIQDTYFDENINVMIIIGWLAFEVMIYFTKKYLNKEN